MIQKCRQFIDKVKGGRRDKKKSLFLVTTDGRGLRSGWWLAPYREEGGRRREQKVELSLSIGSITALGVQRHV